MPTEAQILEALRPVMDPELGLSVVDMGMVRHIELDDQGKVEVQMLLTTPFCPLAGFITEQARQAVAAVPGVNEAKVTLLDEPWRPA